MSAVTALLIVTALPCRYYPIITTARVLQHNGGCIHSLLLLAVIYLKYTANYNINTLLIVYILEYIKHSSTESYTILVLLR